MNPSIRLLKVMEYLMASGQKPVKQIKMSRDLELSPATVGRIVRSLADEGYVLMTSEKYCVCNFRLSRNVPMSQQYLSGLSTLMHDISAEHHVSVEAVVVAGNDLFWHSCTEFPDASIAIKAKPGFRRTLAELDPLSRLYLSRSNWDEIKRTLLPDGFFRNDVNRDIIEASEARNIIEGAIGKTVDYDFDGNHLGVRRFATLIEEEDGQFMHLLSIAEAAVPTRDKASHIAKFTAVLEDAQSRLKSLMKYNNNHSNQNGISHSAEVTKRDTQLQHVG